MKNHSRRMFVCLFALTCLSGMNFSWAQSTTEFTYQGHLRSNGTNANGVHTMVFKLYDAVTNGNQISGSITNSPALADGHFTVNLDFGPGVFNGDARWLDIAVQTGPSTLESLAPRTQIMPVPYALYSSSAGSFDNGTWNAAVGNYPGGEGIVSNVFGFFANSELVFGLSTNGVAVGSDLTVNGNLEIDGGLTVGGDVEIDGNLTVGGQPISISSIPQMQVFNSSGTFTVPGNVTRIMVEVWGGGGGGGRGGGKFDLSSGGDGGGGGGGGYAKAVISVTPGSNLPVTVGSGGLAGGPGGASSIGTVTVGGGMGGEDGGDGTLESSGSAGMGGAGGSAAGQPFAITGQFGQNGFNPGNAGMGFGGSAAGGGFGGNPGGDKSPGGGGSGGKGAIGGGVGIGGGTLGGNGASGRVVVYY